MEDNDKTIQLNTEETERPQDGSPQPGVTDDTIEYTFVVPKGEVYVDPDLEAAAAHRDQEETPQPQEPEDKYEVTSDSEGTDGAKEDNAESSLKQTSAKTLIADRPSKIESASNAGDKPSENPNKGSEEAKDEVKNKEAEDIEQAGEKTRYGLPMDHPEMGELAQKQEARRRFNEDRKRNFRTRFYVITTAIIVIVGGFFFSISSFFTIDSIVVQGNSLYTAEEIINMGHATPGRNIIYKANIKEITAYLEQNPYIKSAVVSRRFPSTLVIKVTERKERLAFKYDDDYLVMDESGILLKKTRNKPKTTLIEGIVVNKIKLGEKIGTENNKQMERVIDLVNAMIDGDLYFVKFDVSDDKTVKAYVYDTLVVKTTYDMLNENIENGKLHMVLEKLFDDGIERGTITFEEDGSASFMPIM